jgi:hypothetical protein
MSTQFEIVQSELKRSRAKGITSWDVIEKYGITRLAHYIHKLRSSGWRITDFYECDPDNVTHKWKRYIYKSSPKMAAMKESKK